MKRYAKRRLRGRNRASGRERKGVEGGFEIVSAERGNYLFEEPDQRKGEGSADGREGVDWRWFLGCEGSKQRRQGKTKQRQGRKEVGIGIRCTQTLMFERGGLCRTHRLPHTQDCSFPPSASVISGTPPHLVAVGRIEASSSVGPRAVFA